MPKPDDRRLLLAGLLVSLLPAAGCRGAETTFEETTMPLRVGDAAPEVTLHLQDGRAVSLSEFRGDRAAVIFFYPKDNTPVCTAEACSFRDAYADFGTLDAEVIGVSADTPASHQKFSAKYNLPFPLASDTDGAIRRAFGVPKPLGFLPGRTTYVIDRGGTVRLVFSAAFAAEKHVTEARRVLAALAEE